MKGITIYRRDMTRPMTEKEQEFAKKYHIDEFRTPTPLRIKFSDGITSNHRMVTEEYA